MSSMFFATAALAFEGISFVGKDGIMRIDNASGEQRKIIEDYLRAHYNATVIDWSFPFLVIGCDSGPPPKEEQPFSVAGMLAIWRRSNDMDFYPLIGVYGRGDWMEIDPSMLSKLAAYTMPPDDVVLYLATELVRDCEAIALIWNSLVIELPLTSSDDFFKRLQLLPSGIFKCPQVLCFHNGPLPGAEPAYRAIQPKPDLINVPGDGMDHLTSHRKCENGTMIASLKRSGGSYAEVTTVAGDEYIVESGSTDKQLFKAFGNRKALGRYETLDGVPPPLEGKKNLLPPSRTPYISSDQVVFVTTAPIHPKPLQAREDCHGSVLLRCADIRNAGLTPQQVMERGEICGMIHFDDLTPGDPKSAKTCLCYANPVEPLLAAGWTIVQFPDDPEEPRGATIEETNSRQF